MSKKNKKNNLNGNKSKIKTQNCDKDKIKRKTFSI